MAEAIGGIGEMIAEGTPRYVITANLNYLMLADQDTELSPVTCQASMILADGQPLVWRSRLAGTCAALPERVAGSELIYRLAQEAAERGWRIFFLGGEPGVARCCADRLAALYPGLRVAGVDSPPYRPLSDDEQRQLHDRIRQSRADVLLVAFGQPKGEKWIHRHHHQLGVPVSMQVGASFDFVAGRARRAPRCLQRLGLEWLYRLASDPRRLLPRYARNAWFLLRSLVR